ncbi:MAG: glycosyltransferase, partial [Planctomycetota bacterium]
MAEANSPKVTVRIPAYNHEKYIHECLESVLNQT